MRGVLVISEYELDQLRDAIVWAQEAALEIDYQGDWGAEAGRKIRYLLAYVESTLPDD